MKRYTDDEVEFLVEHYADNFNEDLALALDRTISSIAQKASCLGLKKSDDFLAALLDDQTNRVKSMRFAKGHTPYNKGKKMRPETKEKIKSFYPKGHTPHNTLHDGAIRKRGDYWYIRLSVGKWRQLHTYTWEQANRPIEPGEMVKFKDGNRDNCNIDNLYLSNTRENMLSNSIQRYPEDLKKTIRELSKLTKAITQHEK